MQQLQTIWSGLDMRRRLIAFLAAAAMFGAVITMSRMATSPAMSLLYAGLEPGLAGEVVTALEQRGVAYDIRGESIFVDSDRRDELRMTLAGEGLPANSAAGYELLDSLSGFGTTAQMFDAAYWRAKEGELARTIVTNPRIRSSRVHISGPDGRTFSRDQHQSASVTATPVSGAISPEQARALRYLVASAVAGLEPENVSVIDGRNGQIVAAEDTEAGSGDRETALREAVTRLLEARVGRGNALVEISIDTVRESESIVERRIDPESRIAISTETEETAGSSEDARGSSVTVASNLPDGEAATGGDASTTSNTETRERVNYEVSETQREILRLPGAIRRLSVAVLVNGVTVGDAPDVEPRSQEELDTLRELVASAVGFEEGRGDVITIKSMALQALDQPGIAAEADFISSLGLNIMSLIQIAVLSVVSLILGLFVVRPILSSASATPPAGLPPPTPSANSGAMNTDMPGLPTPTAGSGALDGEIDDSILPGGMAVVSDFNFDDGAPENPVERLRSMIDDRQDETVEILRNWMEQPERTS